MRILGIDPGTHRIGYALIESKPPSAIDYGLLEIEKNKDFLPDLERTMKAVIKKYQPQLIAIENLFFSKNKKTALQVAEMRGVIKYLAFKNKIHICEINPRTVKLMTAGYGAADKKGVAKIIKIIFHLTEEVMDDVTDALAIAYCGIIKLHQYTNRAPIYE